MDTIPFAEFAEANPKVSLKKEEVFPFVDMAAVTPGQRYVKALEERPFKGGGSKFQSGDTLFARITPCLENGKIAQFIGATDDIVGFGSTEFFVFRARGGVSDSAYLYYLCQTDALRKPAEKSMAGASGRQRADLNSVLSVEVSCPPLPTQRKIASILSAYDDLIENNTRRIAILEEMAQAIYREWFVNFRFPGHENVKLVDSPLGQIPEGWEVVELQQLVSFANGKSIKPGGEGEYLVFGSNGTIGRSDEYKYACGIIIGRVGAYCGSVEYSPEPFWASDNTIVALSQHDDSFIPFVLYMLKDMNLNRHAGGAAQPLLTQTTLKRLQIVAPPNATIDTFCDVAVLLLRQKSCLEKKNDTLRTARDLLLPKLISGKLDVEDLDIDTGLTAEALEEATA